MQLGYFLNEALGGPGNLPGNRLLGLDEAVSVYDLPQDQLDLRNFKLGRHLPVFYEYAFHARRNVSVFDWDDWTGAYCRFQKITARKLRSRLHYNRHDCWDCLTRRRVAAQ
ncbi:protein of unknown function (plasmid) [Candidatus Methylocalor cossyra]|uniref:Uncharacterized protein n=1 Tax=Candidatus Methylocalor cossyra TaxID=3108543 RepID=A0ABM9NMR6_9GAMM